MLGLLIGLAVFGWGIIVGEESMEAVFCGATNFLYIWYWIWAIVLGSIMAVVGIALPLIGAGAGMSAGGTFGGIVGFLLGGAGSMLLSFLFLVGRGLTILGAWLLMTAGNPEMPFSEFSTRKLVAGAIILFIAVIMSRRRSSK